MTRRTHTLALSLAFCGGGAVYIFGGLTFQGWFNVLVGALWIAIGLAMARSLVRH